MPCDFSLRFVGGGLPDFAGWSGYPSIAAFSINPGIDTMGHQRMLRCLAATTQILQQRGPPPSQLSFGRLPSSTGPAWYLDDKLVCRSLEDLSKARFFSQQGHATVFGCNCSTPRSRGCDRPHQECGKSHRPSQRHPRREDGLLK